MIDLTRVIPGKLLSGEVKQLGYIVDDVEKGMDAWTKQVGLGPWICYQNVKLWGTYKGSPTTVYMHVALTYQANMQIELIQPLNDAPSPYKEFTDRGRCGLHHFAYLCEDMQGAVELAQVNELEVTFDITNGFNRYVYLTSPLMPDVFIELIEASKDFVAQFEQGVTLAKNWRGENPVTVIDLSRMHK